MINQYNKQRMRQLILLVFFITFILCLFGCKDSTMQQLKSLGSRHKVTQYGCDGKAIGEWIATGNVSNETNSDGWFFKDEKTDKLVEVTGTIRIEQE
jgi:hypothetical protein